MKPRNKRENTSDITSNRTNINTCNEDLSNAILQAASEEIVEESFAEAEEASAEQPEETFVEAADEMPETASEEVVEEFSAEMEEVLAEQPEEEASVEAADEMPETESKAVDADNVEKMDMRSSVARERWELLHRAPYRNWSYRRLAALGVHSEYQKKISVWEKMGDIPNEDYTEDLANLNERSWEQAIAMCTAWEKILIQHRDALLIAQMQLAHIPDEIICQKLKLTEKDLKASISNLHKTVMCWLEEHVQALAFLRDGYKFCEIPCKEFFGRTVAEIVQNILPAPRILTPRECLIRKLHEQVQHVEMLGDIELSTNEFELLMEECRRRYQVFLFSDKQEIENDIVLSVGLVQIAIREYENHTFWPKVAKYFGIKKTTTALRKLGDLFTRTITEMNKPVSGEGSNVLSIAMHTFVSNPCIPKLFDFLYDYYAIDVGWDKSQLNVDELCSAIAGDRDFVRSSMIYQHTRHAVCAFPQESRRRMQEYLEWIDGAIWDVNYEPKGQKRFVEAFKEWRNRHPELNGTYQTETHHRTGQRRYARPELRLNMQTGKISLSFPRQHLPLHIESDVQWHFDPQIIPDIPCEVIEGVTARHTDEIEVPFPTEYLLSDITCTLRSEEGNLRSFSIAADCVRVFDRQGMQMPGHQLKQGENFCFVSPDAPLKSDGIVDEQPVDRWLMQRCVLSDGDIVFYPDGTVSIVGYDLDEGLCGVKTVEGAYVVANEGEKYDVYPHMPLLFIRTLKEKFANGRLLLNGQYFRLKKLESQTIEMKDRSGEMGFLIKLPVLHKGASGLYTMHCDIPGENDVRVWRFAYMQDFTYRFENDGKPLPYWGVPRGSVTICYPEPLQGQNLVKHPQKNEFGFDIQPDLDELCMQFVSGDFELHLNVPILAWRMDEADWCVTPNEGIWINELGGNFDFKTTEKEVTLMVDYDAQAKGRMVTFSRPQGAPIVSCDLTQLRTWLTKERKCHEIYARVGKRKMLIAKVYCGSILDDEKTRLEVDYKRGGIHGVFDIIGKGKYAVTIAFDNKNVAEQVPIEDNQVFLRLPLPMKAGVYEATVYEVEEDAFGFGSQLNELGVVRCEVINPEDLCGRSFWVKSIATLNRASEKYEVVYKRYWIDLQKRDEENMQRYYGVMRSNSAVRIGEKKEPVIVTVPDRTNITLCQLTFMDEGEEETFLYDVVTRELVRREPKQLHYMERYRRYSLLDTEDLLQVVYL